jgi:hypothetical protein
MEILRSALNLLRKEYQRMQRDFIQSNGGGCFLHYQYALVVTGSSSVTWLSWAVGSVINMGSGFSTDSA